MEKAIITVVGKDTIGILARITTYLAKHQVNVLDISQTVLDGYFNMMLIADVTAMTKAFGECAEDLDAIGAEIGVSVKCQREEIFEKMHRI